MSAYGKSLRLSETQLRDWLSKCPNCSLRPEVSLHANKGAAMVQVGQSFEFDNRLRAYESPPNHLLARSLLSASDKVKNPVIFWLNSSFQNGCNYELHQNPIVHHVLRFGIQYSFQSVHDALKIALGAEGINIDSLGEWKPKK